MLNYSLSTRLCPGLYCGKITLNGSCGSCPRGYTTDHSSICIKCHHKLLLYDWLFLGFMFIQPILFSLYTTMKLSLKLKSTSKLWLLRLLIIITSILSFLVTVILFEPVGKLQIFRCPLERLSDWYTMFYNPQPDFVETIQCTHEAVYPMTTIVLTHHCLSIVLIVFVQPLFIVFLIRDKNWLRCVYYSLYMYPLLSLGHLVLGGVLYYSYGYIIFVAAIIASAGLFSTLLLRNMLELTLTTVLKITFLQPQNFLLVGCTWLALFYGLVTINELKQPTYYGLVFAIIPLPYIIFCATLHFTNPNIEVYTVI